jgi:class 3 adenylate cyclase
LADHIPGARFVPVPGADISFFTEPNAPIADAIEEFLTGAPPVADTHRVLASILFTDIVGSTQQAAELGDHHWHSLVESHHAISGALLEQYDGRSVRSTGDGVLATFDGPGRAIRCAMALRDAVAPLGVQIRAGVHTGEVEVMDGDISGIAVHIAARLLDHAGAREIVVSGVVPFLVAGSGLAFEDRGERELRGVPEKWRLLAVKG